MTVPGRHGLLAWRARSAPVPDHVLERDPEAVTVRLRRRADGTAYVLVHGTVVLERAADLDALAHRLGRAARALEDGAP